MFAQRVSISARNDKGYERDDKKPRPIGNYHSLNIVDEHFAVEENWRSRHEGIYGNYLAFRPVSLAVRFRGPHHLEETAPAVSHLQKP